jgi:uncharacterized protein (DUF1919 family)
MLIRNKNFSIISDDCWGGQLYSELGIPYLTPFVGLYIYVPEYLRLLKNIRQHLDYRLEFIETDKRFPVARLGDVRIFFMHYDTKDEAAEKWYRRRERICWDRLLVKVDLSKWLHDTQTIESWNHLEFACSLALSSSAIPARNCLVIDGWKNNAVANYHQSKKHFASWIWINTFRIQNPVAYKLAYRLLIGDAFCDECHTSSRNGDRGG